MAEIIKQQDSRRVFIDTLVELAEKDDRVVLIVCDVGFNYIEEFQRRFPRQFFNFGVTEQSSMITASTMALSGLRPYIYSMINFMVFRPYEMVRNAVCYHNANVKILGVKGSEKYKFLGFSHNIADNEDVMVLNHLPNLKVHAPSLTEDVKRIIIEEYNRIGPAYIRL